MLRARLAPSRPHLLDFKARHADFRRGDILHSRADISKARRWLGYQPAYTVALGLDEALDWYTGQTLGHFRKDFSMCGIIGYVGRKDSTAILIEGLRRLEYRGYDSAGLAVLSGGALVVRKKQGRIDDGLARLLAEQPVRGTLGIGHTRWATHGPPSDENSHPHLDQSGRIALVHNGIIENCDHLREKLAKAGHVFHSATDTEVLAHLIGAHYERRRAQQAGRPKLAEAVCEALREVIGTYGLAVICSEEPDTIVGARRGSPLIIGIGDDGNFLASDANAIVAHTSQVVYLNDYDVATVTASRFDVQNLGTDTAQGANQQAGIRLPGRRTGCLSAFHAQGDF